MLKQVPVEKMQDEARLAFKGEQSIRRKCRLNR